MAKIEFEDGIDLEEETQEEAATEETGAEDEDESSDEAPEDGEIVVQIGDEEPEEDEDEFYEDEGEKKSAPSWLKELRKTNREQARRIKELEAEKTAPKQEQEEALPEKPKLSDFDYDEEAHAAALLEWADKKRKDDQRKEEAERAQKEAEEAWAAKLAGYAEKKRSLKVQNFDVAEQFVHDTFDQTQQGILIEIADDPALLTYALGTNKKRAAELAKIKQPVQFIKALTLMEAQIKMTTRKGPPPPERPMSGRTGGGADNTLDKLREEAAKTGDMSKVLAYKRKMRA